MDGLNVTVPLPPGTPTLGAELVCRQADAPTVTGNGTPPRPSANGMLQINITDNDSTPSKLDYRGLDYQGQPVAGQRFPAAFGQ